MPRSTVLDSGNGSGACRPRPEHRAPTWSSRLCRQKTSRGRDLRRAIEKLCTACVSCAPFHALMLFLWSGSARHGAEDRNKFENGCM